MKKISLLLISSSILLFGCSDNKNKAENSQGKEEVEETTIDPSELEWHEVVEDVDLSDHIEYYPWKDIHFTKEQFREFTNDMAEESTENDDIEVNIKVLDFDGETIKFSIVEDEEANLPSDYAFEQYIGFFDKNIRYFYLASDYSDNKKHPRIIFYDGKDKVISDNTDFIVNTNPNQK